MSDKHIKVNKDSEEHRAVLKDAANETVASSYH